MITNERPRRKIFFRINDLLELIPLGKSTIHRLIKQGKFPQPIKIGGSILWEREMLEDFFKSLHNDPVQNDK